VCGPQLSPESCSWRALQGVCALSPGVASRGSWLHLSTWAQAVDLDRCLCEEGRGPGTAARPLLSPLRHRCTSLCVLCLCPCACPLS
jgi:hypothetical protein